MTSLRFPFLIAFIMSLASCSLSPAASTFTIPDYKLRFRIDSFVSTNAPSEAAKRSWFINGGKANVPLKESDWCDWIVISGDLKTEILTKRYPNLYLKGFPVVAAFMIHPYPFEQMKIGVEWEVGEAKGTYSATYINSGVATLLWKDAAGKFRVSPASEYNQRYVSQVEKLKLTTENLPKQFVLADRFIGIDGEQKSWDEGLHLLKLLGFNTLANADKSQVSREGIGRTAGAVYWPPLIHDADPKVTNREAMDKWAQEQADAVRKTGWDPKEVALFGLADEPGWYYPAAFNGTWPNKDPAMKARMQGLFREYLKANVFRDVFVRFAQEKAIILKFRPPKFSAIRWGCDLFLHPPSVWRLFAPPSAR